MATLAARPDPTRFRTFDWSIPVEQLVDRIGATRFVRTYGDLLTRDLRPPLADAIRRLLARSARTAWLRSMWHRWRN
jgi:hypothetical protein